jgi:hypothetical protein
MNVRKLFKGGNYSRAETIQGQKLYEEIRYMRLNINGSFDVKQTNTHQTFQFIFILFLFVGSMKLPNGSTIDVAIKAPKAFANEDPGTSFCFFLNIFNSYVCLFSSYF